MTIKERIEAITAITQFIAASKDSMGYSLLPLESVEELNKKVFSLIAGL